MKVVCFSEIQWRYVRTRKQQIISRFPADWEVLFLSSVVAGKKNNFRPERDGRVTHVCVPAFKNFPQKSLRALFSFPPARLAWNAVILVWVKTILLLTGFSGRERVLFVSNIYYSAILPFFPRTILLYDCNDDPLEFPGAPKWARGYFTRLARAADVVVAVSGGLVKRLGDAGVGKIHRIGNGVDYDLFVKAMASGEPEEIAGLRRPRLGYSGAIAPWFDMELLDMVASSFPEASIVLFGPLFEGRRRDLELLREKRRNVHYLGSIPYERLGAYTGSMDVCMIPLQMNELMRMADPNKIYEYAAVEKPIVTFRFSEDMDELSGMIYLAGTRAEFIEKIRAALESGADRPRLREYAMRCSWQARSDAMVALIRSAADSHGR